jgi:hypothetical protein
MRRRIALEGLGVRAQFLEQLAGLVRSAQQPRDVTALASVQFAIDERGQQLTMTIGEHGQGSLFRRRRQSGGGRVKLIDPFVLLQQLP